MLANSANVRQILVDVRLNLVDALILDISLMPCQNGGGFFLYLRAQVKCFSATTYKVKLDVTNASMDSRKTRISIISTSIMLTRERSHSWCAIANRRHH